jgi:hypothetical protein
MSVEVHPYREVCGNIITYNNINYDLNEIPEVFQLRFDVIDEDTEKHLIKLMDSKTPEDKQRLRSASFCIGNLFSEQVNKEKYFNDYEYGILNPGEGMKFINEDKRYYKQDGITSVINMGSDILFTLKNNVTNKMYQIWLPRRSAFVITDPQFIWQRGIANRLNDGYQGKTYDRKKRYSIVFKGKK